MTPEERARQMMQRFWSDYAYNEPELEVDITDAIKAAVQADREACAKVAESRSGDTIPLYPDMSHAEIDLRATRSNTAKMIAAAIRARTSQEGEGATSSEAATESAPPDAVP